MNPVVFTRRPLRRGVTLIEAVLFISVALGLIVGGLVIFNQASLSSRVAAQTRSLAALFSEAQVMLKRAPHGDWENDWDYESLNSILIASGAVPASKIGEPIPFYHISGVVLDTRLRTEWGTALGSVIGNASLGAGAGLPGWATGNDKTLVGFILDSIPPEACSRLAATDNTGRYPFGGITWATRVQRPGHGWHVEHVGPMSPAEAGEMCHLVGDFDGRVTLHVHVFLDRD